MTAELIHERGRVLNDMSILVCAKRLTPDMRAKFDILDTKQQKLRARIAQIERARRTRQDTDERYYTAWRAAMRYGYEPDQFNIGISEEYREILQKGTKERRTLSEGVSGGAYPGSGSGFFAPVEFEFQIESALRYYGPMLDVSTPLDTTLGTPCAYPSDNDIQTAGEQVDENNQVTDVDVPLGSTVFKSYKYSSRMVKISAELMQDSAFDFESYLGDVFGRRIGRALNPLFTNGSGTNQPQGIIQAATVGVTATGASDLDGGTSTGANSIGMDDLVNLEHSLDVSYRKGAMYMMNDTSLRAVKLLKDKSGRPLFIGGLAAGMPDTVNNYPVVTNPDMAAIAPGALSVAFGRLDKYIVRRAGPMWVQRLNQRFSDYGLIAFLAWARRDGRLLDAGSHPVMLLQQSAS